MDLLALIVAFLSSITMLNVLIFFGIILEILLIFALIVWLGNSL